MLCLGQASIPAPSRRPWTSLDNSGGVWVEPSLASTRVAMPTAGTSGGTPPLSGSNLGVSGMEGAHRVQHWSPQQIPKHVATTIICMHPRCDIVGCSSGMRCDASWVLRHRDGERAKAQALGVPIQIYLTRPDSFQITI